MNSHAQYAKYSKQTNSVTVLNYAGKKKCIFLTHGNSENHHYAHVNECLCVD